MEVDSQTGRPVPSRSCEIREFYAAPVADCTHVRCSCGWIRNFSWHEYTDAQIRTLVDRHVATGELPPRTQYTPKELTKDEYLQRCGWPPGDKGTPI